MRPRLHFGMQSASKLFLFLKYLISNPAWLISLTYPSFNPHSKLLINSCQELLSVVTIKKHPVYSLLSISISSVLCFQLFDNTRETFYTTIKFLRIHSCLHHGCGSWNRTSVKGLMRPFGQPTAIPPHVFIVDLC